jgi:hypothetical protein
MQRPIEKPRNPIAIGPLLTLAPLQIVKQA